MLVRSVASRLLTATIVTVLCLGLAGCHATDDGVRLLRLAVTKSTPVVRSLPTVPDDVALADAARRYLSQLDASLLAEAHALSQDEGVQLIVWSTCTITGLGQANPDEVIADLEAVVSQSESYGSMQLLRADAAATVENVRSETAQSLVMTKSAALALAILQEVYC